MRLRISVAALALPLAAGAAYGAEFSAPIVSQPGATVGAAFGPRAESAGIHPGTDIAVAAGTAVHAPASGRVLRVGAPGALNGYGGQVVEIDHGDRVRTRYSNLDGVTLTEGAEIRAGDTIGRIRAMDRPHVHVELWRDGALVDPAHEIALIAAD
ncbi:MAG: murein hydrolase activator EnvC family protein [Vitreimonas sp.]